RSELPPDFRSVVPSGVFSWHGRRLTRPSPYRKARIADRGNGGAQVFTVTHTFHPLRGQTFDAIAVRNNWGGDRVSYLDAKGRLRTLPVEWTDIQGPDP